MLSTSSYSLELSCRTVRDFVYKKLYKALENVETLKVQPNSLMVPFRHTESEALIASKEKVLITLLPT